MNEETFILTAQQKKILLDYFLDKVTARTGIPYIKMLKDLPKQNEEPTAERVSSPNES